MTCEEARIVLAEELAGGRTSAELEGHLASCRTCQAEAAGVRDTWARLGSMPEPEPGPWVATRFYAALDAWQLAARDSKRNSWAWWPSRPVWQAAISAGCLAAGLLAGAFLMSPRGESHDVAELRREMAGMRQLVTLSLLQQQSATDRLRGVNWSYRAEPEDTEVLSALLRTINEDSSVDVRLAAVDALRNFSDSGSARQGLVDALTQQRQSPLVQIAILDAIADLRQRSAASSLRGLLEEQDLDVNVRRRAEQVLKTFH